MLQLPRSTALVARLLTVESAGSTNADLVAASAADPEAWPAPAVLVTDRQTAGRGRLGRSWSSAPGDSLAISVLLRPEVPRDRLGWLSPAAGAAMVAALRGLGVDATGKWPNDVLVGGRKVCGVLAEATADGIVIGAGLNHAAGPAGLASATSLAAEGGPTDPDLLVAAYLERLLPLARRFEEARGDAVASGLRTAVLAASGTVGRPVRVTLPDSSVLTGTAVDIDDEGRVVVDPGPFGTLTAIAAGDVEHLRYE